jgi:hypothetical protein
VKSPFPFNTVNRIGNWPCNKLVATISHVGCKGFSLYTGHQSTLLLAILDFSPGFFAQSQGDSVQQHPT